MAECHYSREEAQKLIDEADQVLVASGAIIVKAEKEGKALKQKSNNNIKKLSLLL